MFGLLPDVCETSDNPEKHHFQFFVVLTFFLLP